MFCTKARKLISLEIDGLLPATDTLDFEHHLARCADCRGYREDLAVGSRLLHATAAQPSEGFEWNLQLKLNRALQEAAATRTLPWEDVPSAGFGWWRSFAASSLAGVAVAAVVALWIWPGGQPARTLQSPLASGAATVTQLAEAATGMDRLPITLEGTRRSVTGAGLFGRQVNQGILSNPARLVSSRLTGMDWSGQDMQGLGSQASLREENLRLRSRLQSLEIESAALKSLLERHGIEYLEPGADAAR